MTALAILIAVIAAIAALGIYLDHIGFNVRNLFGSDYLAPWSAREPGDLS
jgi:hypothetical protein